MSLDDDYDRDDDDDAIYASMDGRRDARAGKEPTPPRGGTSEYNAYMSAYNRELGKTW